MDGWPDQQYSSHRSVCNLYGSKPERYTVWLTEQKIERKKKRKRESRSNSREKERKTSNRRQKKKKKERMVKEGRKNKEVRGKMKNE